MTPDLKELEQSTETIVLNALNRAYQLGQTYWQQADSESYSQNAKSDVTAEKFLKLRDETRISVCGLEVENFALRSGTGHLGELIDELRAELEQAKKDAERWRVTRSIDNKGSYALFEFDHEGLPNHDGILIGGHADAAADAAIAKEQS